MEPPSDGPPKAPRMSIKFNTTSNKPNAGRPAKKPPSSLGKRHRGAHALGGSSDDDDDSGSEHGRGGDGGRGSSSGRIVFGEHDARRRDRRGDGDRDGRRRDGGGRRGSPAEGRGGTLELGAVPKIIRPPETSRRPKMRNRVVDGEGRNGAGVVTKEVEPADGEKEVKWGLSVSKKSSSSSSPSPGARGKAPESAERKDAEQPREPPRTVDEQAMDRLLGREPAKDEKVIHLSERDAYARDVDEAPPPDATDLDTGFDVTEFGAAMLRGMGWDGDFSRPGFKQVSRRANQLGLGAKELKGKEDLGGWDQKGKGKGGAAAGDRRPKRLADYRREQEREREGRRGGGADSYKREREREREEEGERGGRYDRGDERRRRR